MNPAIIAAVWPEALSYIAEGKCPICHEPVGMFRDVISQKEFEISGLCQYCQDSIFEEANGY